MTRESRSATALTVKDVAEFLGVNERTIYRLAVAGQIPGFKVGGHWRFLTKDLDSWIEDQKQRCDGTQTPPVSNKDIL